MILEEIRNLKNDEREYRKFGLTVGSVFSLLGAWLAWKGSSAFLYFALPGGILILLGILAPRMLKFIYRIWMTFALLLGWVMTGVLLTVFFYLVMTPAGFLGRLFGKKFLDLKFQDKRASYWIERPRSTLARTDYERQF
jgi:polyferredoxin